MTAPPPDRNQEATVYIGNIDERVTDQLIWELMLQAGPVVNVNLPKDRVTGSHQSFGFCEFLSEEDADYAIKIMNMIRLYGKPIRVNKASADKEKWNVGANLFIGNLDADVDEKMLYDTFSAFGAIVQTPKIGRDPDTGASKGFGFVNYDTFEASDAAIEAMNGQYLCNRPISVNYAFRKDSRGERHGSQTERILAATSKQAGGAGASSLPNRYFADVSGSKAAAAFQQPPPPPMVSGYMAHQHQHQHQQQPAAAYASMGYPPPPPSMQYPPPPPPPQQIYSSYPPAQ